MFTNTENKAARRKGLKALVKISNKQMKLANKAEKIGRTLFGLEMSMSRAYGMTGKPFELLFNPSGLMTDPFSLMSSPISSIFNSNLAEEDVEFMKTMDELDAEDSAPGTPLLAAGFKATEDVQEEVVQYLTDVKKATDNVRVHLIGNAKAIDIPALQEVVGLSKVSIHYFTRGYHVGVVDQSINGLNVAVVDVDSLDEAAAKYFIEEASEVTPGLSVIVYGTRDDVDMSMVERYKK